MTTTLQRNPEPDLQSLLHEDQLPTWLPRTLVAGAALITILLVIGTSLSIAQAVLIGWLLTWSLPIASRVVEGGRKAADRTVTLLVASAFGLALIPLGSILALVISRGAPQLNAEFLTYSMRNVVGEGGGIYHALVGTLLVTAAATVISVPIGLFTAIYLVEYGDGNRLSRWITFLVDVMTGIPSIVAGLFAYALFVIFFGEGIRLGIGGAVALAVLMVPIVVRACEEMLKLVPNELREASFALGVPKWRTVVKVVLPTAISGIVTGVTLAIARVIGETAPLLIIAGLTDSVNFNLFSERMTTLPVFTYFSVKFPGVPPEASIDRGWGAALVLIIIVMVLNLIARAVSYFFSPKGER
ncbi:MAG: phosphate ABC transporter permease PstA [Aeromicrobium sp.]|uniref:phosphate ABC transporter permease PstA n=1 Tax=Aeromicrobium sp. TaxID=1871063 RepID=UPI00262F0BBF|nr:phosphate ABC transporter permease PstA [Aeromicrobium sp.]MDF1704427.1 phosphate ABC transporter permease PstA [Aeromicrobium sp.]